jgi:hypothetical protein
VENKTLTHNLLKSLLLYDHKTGLFTWAERPIFMFLCAANKLTWNKRFAGSFAGGIIKSSCKKYLIISINKKRYCAHRLAWFYMTGNWPKYQIDHIDGNGLNNSWGNLRDVDGFINHKNMRLKSCNTSGFCGVWYNRKNKKWCSEIKVDLKKISLGSFVEKEDAISARAFANIKYGFHENHGEARPL